MNKNLLPVYLILIGIAIGFVFGTSCSKQSHVTVKTTDTVWATSVVPILRIDTLIPKTKLIYKYIDNWDTLTITKVDTLNDTTYVYRSLPYVATLDTATATDTLKLKYHFPQNTFTDIYHGSKALNVPLAVNNTTTVQSTTKWTEYAIPAVSFVIGFIFGAKIK